MKITIIVDDGFVAVDGEGFNGIDLSELAAENIHAVQFYGTWGEVEFKPFMHLGEDGFAKLKKPQNDVFSAEYISVFQREIDRWAMAKEQARIAAEAQAVQPAVAVQ